MTSGYDATHAHHVPQGTPPAGWHPDPAGGAGLRYWDGANWTAHTAPGAPQLPQKSGGAGKKVIIIVIIVVSALVLFGLLAAAAIPVYLNQQSIARDSAAQADLAGLRVDVMRYWVDNPNGPAPSLQMEGREFVLVTPQGTEVLETASLDVALGASDIRTINDWCISVTVEDGNVGVFHATGDASRPILDGPCP